MFRLDKNGEVLYYTITSFEETGLVRHGFTTRKGGVSSGCCESMNLRFNSDDTQENVLENYRIISSVLGIDCKKIVRTKQVHDNVVRTVGEADAGNGIIKPDTFGSADAIVTDCRCLPLSAYFADCTPVFFLDRKKKIIALAHSGWRGTVKCISSAVVSKMKNDYGSDPADILTAIGPSIRVECYEVGDDVAEKFGSAFGEDTVENIGGRPHVNMQLAITKQLISSGIPAENIDDSGICTCCNSELLFSHRKTHGKRGNLGAFISLI